MTGRCTMNRAAVLEWLTASPGLTTAEISLRGDQLPAYTSWRMRELERAGFVIGQRLPDTATGRLRLCWFVNPKHPPLTRKKWPPLPKPREHLVRKPERPQGVAQQLVRVCRAPDHDSSIVAQALAAAPALQVAWMGRAQA